ncbi:MAG: DUF6597 domain-containing transcriptional factor [Bacteroidota bacterium]
MVFQEIKPNLPLRPYINCFWYYDESQKESALIKERVIPNGCMELIFHLGDRVIRSTSSTSGSNPRFNFVGQKTSAYFIQPTGSTRMFGIRFFPHTTTFLIPVPLAELTNQVLPLDTIFGSSINQLSQQIYNLQTPEQIVPIVTKFLLNHLSTYEMTYNHQRVELVVRKILKSRGGVRIDVLAQKMDISCRYLELIFKEFTGISPKLFSRITQFQTIFELINQQPTLNLTQLAYLNNYADQAHFTRTCKQFTGVSPKHFLTESRPMIQNFVKEGSLSYFFNLGN